MDAQQFAYWLQGFSELSGDTPPTKAQWKSIREHLGLVFKKVTPPVDMFPPPELRRQWLNPASWPSNGDPLPPYPTVTCSIAASESNAQVIC